jgi:hypothetical protein
MKRFFEFVVFAWLCAGSGAAQNKPEALLLEADMLGAGMASPQGTHLYLRVYIDGRVEYEDERMKGSTLEYFIRRSKLSGAEIKDLSVHLNGSSVRALAKDYAPLDPPLDHAIDLTVSLTHVDQTQTIVIRNFSPTSPKASEAYPASLIELLCRIERLRKGASFGITADATKWCSSFKEFSATRKEATRCQYWQSKVDAQVQPPTVAPGVDLADQQTILDAIECLLEMEGNKHIAKFGGAQQPHVSQIFDSTTAEVAALYYASYLYYQKWDYADAVALRDEDGAVNTPKAVRLAYRSYKKWFKQVKKVGLARAREMRLAPLKDSKVHWY